MNCNIEPSSDKQPLAIRELNRNHSSIGADPWVKTRVVLNAIGICRQTLYNWIESGKFPQPIRVGGRHNAWPKSVVLKWMEDKQSTAEGGENV
jgi:predicted DNA-binding transcriptional regulator AlpA